jgi:tRNA(Ile)-lysidine synthase
MLEQTVFNFLDHHCKDATRPVLLGLSGGPDSLALYHILLKYLQKRPLKLGIAHIDHGWRTESSEEAAVLEKMVQAENLPFHCKRLDPDALVGNLEAACRKERILFFAELCLQYDYQAVLLAHHADDQAETVLKRVFEGAAIHSLSGLCPSSVVDTVLFWRPLLKIPKQSILQWLSRHGLKGFEDSTNNDAKFLRGRMRTRLLPALSAEFGKEIGKSLEYLGEEAGKWRDYMDQKLFPYVTRIEKGSQGLYLDLSRECPSAVIELEYLIRKFSKAAELILSRTCLQTAVKLVISNAADRQINKGNRIIFIDRRRLFLPHRSEISFNGVHSLKLGQQHAGDWTIDTIICDERGKQSEGWKAVWDGQCETWLPAADYVLRPPKAGDNYPGGSPLSKWWTEAKVPAFLRGWAPVVWEGSILRHEFLTGIPKTIQNNGRGWLKIVLQRVKKLDISTTSIEHE